MTQHLFIDFENTQKVKLEDGGGAFDKIYIFVGRGQNKLDFELVQSLQALGSRVEWVKIGGEGKNNLDFHLSYMLGRMDSETDRATGFVVLSRDKGYDALLRYINERGREARRVDSLGRGSEPRSQEPRAAEARAPRQGSRRRGGRRTRSAAPKPEAALAQQPETKQEERPQSPSDLGSRILGDLSRLKPNQRPVSKKSFLNYLVNQHGAGKTAPAPADLMETVLQTGEVYLEGGKVKYRL